MLRDHLPGRSCGCIRGCGIVGPIWQSPVDLRQDAVQQGVWQIRKNVRRRPNLDRLNLITVEIHLRPIADPEAN